MPSGWSLDPDGNIRARQMVTGPTTSDYRTRLTGLLGSIHYLTPAIKIAFSGTGSGPGSTSHTENIQSRISRLVKKVERVAA